MHAIFVGISINELKLFIQKKISLTVCLAAAWNSNRVVGIPGYIFKYCWMVFLILTYPCSAMQLSPTSTKTNVFYTK